MALDCSTCMACCLYESLLPVEQIPSLSDELKEEANQIIETNFERCVWLVITQDGLESDPCGKCLHYDLRPQVCRDFKVGGEMCLKARKYLAS